MLDLLCNSFSANLQHISIDNLQVLSENLLSNISYYVCKPADCRDEYIIPIIFICASSVIISMYKQCTATGTVYLVLRYLSYWAGWCCYLIVLFLCFSDISNK